jgi:hypothetical protein
MQLVVVLFAALLSGWATPIQVSGPYASRFYERDVQEIRRFSDGSQFDFASNYSCRARSGQSSPRIRWNEKLGWDRD